MTLFVCIFIILNKQKEVYEFNCLVDFRLKATMIGWILDVLSTGRKK
jgi:hypothetical protein